VITAAVADTAVNDSFKHVPDLTNAQLCRQ